MAHLSTTVWRECSWHKASRKQDVSKGNSKSVTQAHYDQSVSALRVRNTFVPAVGVLGFLSNVVMLGMGVWFIWRGEFTLGGLIAYRGYWWRLQSPISTLARMTDTLLRAKAAARRVVEVLDTPIEIFRPVPGRLP